MEYEQAQTEAIKKARNHFAKCAVVWKKDGQWQAGYHHEDRYLETYFKSDEIHVCKVTNFNPTPDSEWRVYKSPNVSVDYVNESGATEELAELLRVLSEKDKE